MCLTLRLPVKNNNVTMDCDGFKTAVLQWSGVEHMLSRYKPNICLSTRLWDLQPIPDKCYRAAAETHIEG